MNGILTNSAPTNFEFPITIFRGLALIAEPLIRFKGVSKSFPGVRALKGIDLDISPGSCHALVGENGAGKSTLGKILAGIYAPDAGEMVVDGRKAQFRGPREAMRAGIGMVHQELLFCDNLTVAENMCLGRLPGRGPFVSNKRMIDMARDWLDRVEARTDPSAILGELPISRQQLVQIASAMSRGARILILDEPTSSLSRHETERLFDLIKRLKSQGVTIIYVSHRLAEIFHIADMVTVLRDGEVVATRPTSEYDEDTLVRLMIGRSLEAYFPRHLDAEPTEELLRVERLTSPGKFEDISFSLRAGEVLGLAGLVGSGRTEIAEAIFGLDPAAVGTVFVRGRRTRPRSPRKAMGCGMGMIPEDRKRHGLILSMNARENTSLPTLERLSFLGWVRHARERALVREYFAKLRVRAPDIDAATEGLSGGNQQKLVIARWMAAECEILLVDEPTRGVDVGAKAEIHGLIDRLAHSGAGILLISSDLPEIINLSTRILVIRNGGIVGEMPRQKASQESLMRLMAGLSADKP